MGRPKKPVYTASEDYLSFTEELIHSYPSIKEYCLRYEQSHKLCKPNVASDRSRAVMYDVCLRFGYQFLRISHLPGIR